MRIAFITDTSLDSGGIANYSRALRSEFQCSGHDSRIFGVSSNDDMQPNDYECSYGAIRSCIPTFALPFLYSRTLRKLVAGFNPDICIASRQGGALWCVLHRKKFIYFVHQSETHVANLNNKRVMRSRPAKFVFQHLDRLIFRKALRVWIPSGALLKECLARGADQQKVKIAMPILDARSFQMSQMENYTGQDLELVWIGRLTALKQPLEAVKIVAGLSGQGTKVRMTMFGRGEMETDVKDFISQMGLESTITLAGYRPRPEVETALRESSALLISSQSESFGLVAIEALEAGTPVISTAVGVLPDLARMTGKVLIYSREAPPSLSQISELLGRAWDGQWFLDLETWSTKLERRLMKDLDSLPVFG